MKKLFLWTFLIVGLHGSQGFAQITCDNSCDYPASFDGACCYHISGFEGFYIGANLGYAMHQRSVMDRDAWLETFTTSALDSTFTLNDGVAVGAQAGYNWQCGEALFGFEADFDWGDLTRTKNYERSPVVTVTHGDTCHWFGTIRGRAGLVANNLLLYGTAGAGWAIIKHSFSEASPIGAEGHTISRTHWGLTVGGGAEWLFSENYTLRGEALYIKFPEFTDTIFSSHAHAEKRFDRLNTVWIARLCFNVKLCSLFNLI